MANEVTVKVRGQEFTIACEDGQEDRIQKLGEYVDQHLKDIEDAGAADNERYLLVLTSLVLADQVFDLKEQLESMGHDIPETSAADSSIDIDSIVKDALNDQQNQLAGHIDQITEHVEFLTKKLANA